MNNAAQNHWIVVPRILAALLAGVRLAAVTPSDCRGESAFEWQQSTPAEHSASKSGLDRLRDGLASRNTKALLVIRDDCIIYEWYAAGHSATKPHYSASMAKALVGGVTLAVAMDDGRIALDAKAAKYVPQWREDPGKSQITIRQLGSHTSGIADAEQGDLPHDKLTGWQGDFWKRLDPPDDPFSIARDLAPLVFDPGTSRQYSNPAIAMLGYSVTAALTDALQRDLRTLLRERVMRPIGVPDKEWSCGYGETFRVDGLPLVASWGGGSFTARAAARIGRLMLRQGDWDGRRIISASSVQQTTTSSGLPGAGGMGWWTNADGKVPALPADAFWAAGAGGQVTLVVPSLQLIAVRNGNQMDKIDNDLAITRYFFTPLMAAIDRSSPAKGDRSSRLPPSRVISALTWTPAETVIRQARGSDNWPITWADDDALYTAFGDGRGFEPYLPNKLSLGLAKVNGAPPNFHGSNMRAPSAESLGDGSTGYKASGMLMVDGVLYMLVRNVGNSQLAWSTNHGQDWQWAEWKFETSFGTPSFVNFGRNYGGARDNFVYIVSHDADSAYETADACVLARAPQEHVRDQAAWEYFAGVIEGQPKWTTDVNQRAPILTNVGTCYRTSMTYNAPLARFLLVQPVPPETTDNRPAGRPDTRFAGGLAIYDAPEPWGPWTTTFYTELWDIGPGESCGFPAKWIGPDGRELFLVFSGDDCFSVRRATLTLR